MNKLKADTACTGSFVGRVVTGPCDTCGHMLCVHMADRSCSICGLIEYLTDPENCITPSVPALHLVHTTPLADSAPRSGYPRAGQRADGEWEWCYEDDGPDGRRP